MKNLLDGAIYSAWDIHNAVYIAMALDDLADSPEATDAYLDVLLTSWRPQMYIKRHPNEHGFN